MPPIATYDPIATQTLSSTSPTVTFSNISGNYTDLAIVANVNSDTATHFYARWGNGSVDTGSNYSQTAIFGRRNGANSAYEKGSERSSDFSYARITPFTYGVPSASLRFGLIVINLNNYSNTTTFKPALIRASTTENYAYAGTEMTSVLWRSTAAINQIQFSLASGNFNTGSTFSIYGIKGST